MKYVAPSFAWQPKDWRDQPLHFLAGFGSAIVFMVLHPAWWTAGIAFTITMFVAGWREYEQHSETRVVFDLDLLMTFFGVTSGIFAMLLLCP